MKKIVFVPLALLSIFFISCATEGGQSAATKKNLDAMHGVRKAFETKDFSKIGDYIAEDAVDHAGPTGDIKGLAAMKVAFEKMAASTENEKSVVIKELADDEYVMSWMQFTGTMKVADMGMKPGDKFDMKAIEVVKFKDGKAIEHWTYVDPAEMMKAMGGMQQQPNMTMPADTMRVDTTKK